MLRDIFCGLLIIILFQVHSCTTTTTSPGPVYDETEVEKSYETNEKLNISLVLNRTIIAELMHSKLNDSDILKILKIMGISIEKYPDIAKYFPVRHKSNETVSFWPWQILIIVVYSATAILSLTLNIISILVMIRKDRSISTELWKFLVNLSAADIGMAIFCIPFTYTEVSLPS